ncbi:ABC transporter ATP-binding protein [Alkalibacter mobilis]|uniref:ABC transporter ATP-binding protein n=1 Tax=Alkalibacter mobilis TaxID=2787712 RepID=UPI0018A0D264|nr:ABC transporter ATP-binding protein [Alkalibacter mobilis]MBF7096790.1 ABC transporter ATP-binding protein [Alkalibacter mobilis]
MKKNFLSVSKLNIKMDNSCVLSDISFELESGEILTIVGESGSGKTTLLKSIIRLLPPKAQIISGNILFEGKVLSENNLKRIRGKEIAFVFQNPGDYMDAVMRIDKQFINFIKRHQGGSSLKALSKSKKILKSLKFIDVEKVLKSYPHQLSGGMKQRIALGMALVLDPKLVMADEPTSALDVLTQRDIMTEIKNMRDRDNTSFLIVTHDLGYAAQISDRIIVMQQGKIVEIGTPIEIIQNPLKAYTKELVGSIPGFKEAKYG